MEGAIVHYITAGQCLFGGEAEISFRSFETLM
jgi:hypothetical protein